MVVGSRRTSESAGYAGIPTMVLVANVGIAVDRCRAPVGMGRSSTK